MAGIELNWSSSRSRKHFPSESSKIIKTPRVHSLYFALSLSKSPFLYRFSYTFTVARINAAAILIGSPVVCVHSYLLGLHWIWDFPAFISKVISLFYFLILWFSILLLQIFICIFVFFAFFQGYFRFLLILFFAAWQLDLYFW